MLADLAGVLFISYFTIWRPERDDWNVPSREDFDLTVTRSGFVTTRTRIVSRHLPRLVDKRERNNRQLLAFSLAAREFALGVEGLDRFIAREPLRRLPECVFGILALESEPVDPGL